MAVLNDKTLIRFPRCKYVATSRQAAMLHLMEDFEHVVGQPVIVGYYKDTDQKEVDTIVAMGIRNGKGKDNFRVITTGQFIIVWDIINDLPDVSSLVHGEVVLYKNKTTGVWNMVSLDPVEKTRKIEPINGDPKFYINLKDNTLWVSDSDKVVRPLSSIYTKSEIDAIIKQIKIDTDFTKIEEKLNKAVEDSEYAVTKVEEFEKRIEDLEQGSESRKIIANIHNYIKAINVVKIDGIEDNKTWYGPGERRDFAAGSIEFEIIYHNYDGTEVIGEFDEVTISLGDETTETPIYPGEDGYYSNNTSIILSGNDDVNIPIHISATYQGTKKYGTLNFYGLSGFKYTGRVESPEEIVPSMLDKETEYDWEKLKEKENLNISPGNAGYFVYMYPESWGGLEKIFSSNFIYYTEGRDDKGVSTFTKKAITINDTTYLCYYYRYNNSEEAINVNFL